MKYLVLTLHGALQSWGGESTPTPNAGSPRTTETMPTLGALYGLIRASMGDDRDTERPELHDTHVFIRGDRMGSIARDYQIARRTHHGFIAGNTVVTPKMHIQDATFTVLIGHPDETIVNHWAQALTKPVWAPYLGRKAHVPSLPVLAGTITTDEPLRALKHDIPVLWGAELGDKKRVPILTNQPLLEATDERVIKDVPLRYNPSQRSYAESTMHRTYFYTERNTPRKSTTMTQFKTLVQSLKHIS